MDGHAACCPTISTGSSLFVSAGGGTVGTAGGDGNDHLYLALSCGSLHDHRDVLCFSRSSRSRIVPIVNCQIDIKEGTVYLKEFEIAL